MRQIIKNFQKYRFLLSQLVVKEIKLKYRKSYLGILWTMIEPLLTMIVLYLVFSKLRKHNDRTFAVYILTGRLLYSYFSHATKSAMKSIRVNAQMIKKVYVPKYFYPLASVLSQFITFLISLVVLAAVSIILRVKPTVYIFEAVIPITILFFMALGVGLILATLAIFFRDMEYLWDVLLMLIMYCSAIFYYPSMVSDHSWILKMNPLYAVILNFRNSVLEGMPFDFGALLYSLTFSVIALLAGIWLFYKNQDRFILYL